MTRDEAVKWLTNLKSDIGKMQFVIAWVPLPKPYKERRET